MNLPESPWSLSAETVCEQLAVNPKTGLSESEVQSRQERFGANRLEQAKQRSPWAILIDQFKSPIIGILAVAAVLSFLFQEWIEGAAIIVAIILNAVIGFFTEWQAVRSMKALQQLNRTTAVVRREGQVQEINTEAIVPGDIVILDSGDVVAADSRLLESAQIQVNESSLTGESLPVGKSIEPLEEDIPLADRANILYKGTAISRGGGEGVVVATGMDTELGHISQLAQEAGSEQGTPLERRLNRLGRKLIWVTLGLVVIIAVSGFFAGQDLALMIKTAIALAVAAIPEGLPIVATVALARGMWRMARRNALINQLSAVETLGATNVICTDKTGTLTENRMTVTDILLANGRVEVSGRGLEPQGRFTRQEQRLDPQQEEGLRRLLEVGVLCNNAALQPPESNESRAVGDPMEVALLVLGAKANFDRSDLIEKLPEEREVAFDPDLKMMATVHPTGGNYRYAVKGAPEAVLPLCQRLAGEQGDRPLNEQERQAWQEHADELAGEGLRLLALAEKTIRDKDGEAYEDLTFLGVVGLLDPPREEVRSAIDECQAAGIKVVMVTGDQAITARNIALATGLIDDENADAVEGKDLKSPEDMTPDLRQRILNASILARVSPEQKLNLVTLHRENGRIVAMTGDGVNDAPALQKADIGVAMGQRGTQVAKEAADMVLQDDAFATIVAAVEQGRAIFNNIRKFTVFLLSGNVGQIIAVTVASLSGLPLPIQPLQILYLNIINDVFPALALGVGEGEADIMDRPPRDPQEEIIARSHWWAIFGYGLVISGAVLGSLAIALFALGMESQRATTVSFLTIAFARLWHVFNMRSAGSGLLKNEVTLNRYVWGALVLCIVVLIAAVYVPGLSDILEAVRPGVEGWLVILGMSLVPLIVGQIFKQVQSSPGQHQKR